MLIRKMQNNLQSITAQIFAFFWFTLTILLLLAFFIPSLDNRIYKELKNDELAAYQKQIVTSIRNNQISHLLIAPSKLSVDAADAIHPILVDKNNSIIGAKNNELNAVRQFVVQSNNTARPLVKNFDNIQLAGPFIVHTNSRTDEPFLLYFVKKVNPQQEALSFMFDHPAIMILLIMLLSSPFLWWLAWNITRPVRKLQQFASAVTLGDFTKHKELEQQGPEELRQLSRSFNKMTEALDDLLSTRQSLLYSISHELRTPLTRLQLAAALIRRRQGESNEIKRIETETERLDNMINDLLALSRNQLKAQLERDIFPITEFWEEVIEDTKFEAEQRNISFNVIYKIPSPEKYTITGNQQSLASALENILRNALKYTNNTVNITFSLELYTLCICIDDNGPGIPDEEYSKIFIPFYRIDTARTRSTGGTGLGLAIVKNIIQQHHGEIMTSRSKLGGLKVTMKLPL
ncbi:envelope stress sensor histidine kinase CpxA [Pasteurella bettyae]|uniref:envelope stress sensor histidine kinase CpxA n=1 Tax=Pasteurella bettyae TaxID=752 RepID=UPI003D29A547